MVFGRGAQDSRERKENMYTNLPFLLPSGILMASSVARGQSNPADADQTGSLPEHKAGWEKMEKGSEKANGERPAQRLTMVR